MRKPCPQGEEIEALRLDDASKFDSDPFTPD